MDAPIGLIAGAGKLPELVAEQAQQSGRSVVVIRLEGMADPSLAKFAGEEVKLGALGDVVRVLKGGGCSDLSFAGKVARPDFHALGLDELAMSHLPILLEAAGAGDDALMRAVGGIFEAEGFHIAGLDEVARDLLCPGGVIAGEPHVSSVADDLARAFHVAGIIGEEDIGQGCVVCDGLVLAVEAQEGTNAMLERLMTLPGELKGSVDKRRGVLVKRAKPGQDLRMDLPVVGLETLERAAAAGLAGVGLEAGKSILVERGELIALAAAAGMAVVGLGADGRVV